MPSEHPAESDARSIDARATVYAHLGLAVGMAAGVHGPAFLEVSDGWKLLLRLVGTFAALGGVLFLAHGLGARATLAELGFDRSALRGLGSALILTSPMVIGMLVAGRGVFSGSGGMAALMESPWRFLGSWAGAGLIEEALFRGFYFRQLVLRGGWSVARAMLVCGVIFGLLHVPPVWGDGPGKIIGVVAITGIGGAAFSWLLTQWNWNLWFLVGWHALVNLYWTLGQAGNDAVGDGLSNVLRIAVIVVTFWVTANRQRLPARIRDALKG